MAPSRRLGALLAQLGANEPPSSSTALCTTALSTANHPANQRYGLGEPGQRQLRTLTEDQLSLFWENGFLVVEDLLSPAETQSLAERTDMIARGETGNPAEVIQVEPEVVKAKTGSDPGGPGVSAGSRLDILTPEEQVYSVRKLFNLCDTDDVMFGHAANPKIVDVIADLLGCDDIKVYGDQLFMKNPGGVGSAIPWHQDSYSWMEISPRDLISCWTSMDHATIENGCLHFLPGSHRWGIIGQTRGDNGKEHPLSADWFTERWPAVPVELRPGSCSFHHSMTMHMSSENHSDQRRRGYAIHYMRATSVLEGDHKSGAKGTTAKSKSYRSVRGRSFPGRV